MRGHGSPGATSATQRCWTQQRPPGEQSRWRFADQQHLQLPRSAASTRNQRNRTCKLPIGVPSPGPRSPTPMRSGTGASMPTMPRCLRPLSRRFGKRCACFPSAHPYCHGTFAKCWSSTLSIRHAARFEDAGALAGADFLVHRIRSGTGKPGGCGTSRPCFLIGSSRTATWTTSYVTHPFGVRTASWSPPRAPEGAQIMTPHARTRPPLRAERPVSVAGIGG